MRQDEADFLFNRSHPELLELAVRLDIPRKYLPECVAPAQLASAIWDKIQTDGKQELFTQLVSQSAPPMSPGVNEAPLPDFDPRWLDNLETPGGALRSDSPFYIERDLDRRAHQVFSRQGATISIRGPRQSGKSSALGKIYAAARRHGSALFIDFQRIDKEVLRDLGTLLRYLADMIALRLKVLNGPQASWKAPLGPKDNLTAFM
jgi:hypothetical protein